VPGAMAFLGDAAEGAAWARCSGIHSSRMMVDETVLPRGAAILAGCARRFFERRWNEPAAGGANRRKITKPTTGGFIQECYGADTSGGIAPASVRRSLLQRRRIRSAHCALAHR